MTLQYVRPLIFFLFECQKNVPVIGSPSRRGSNGATEAPASPILLALPQVGKGHREGRGGRRVWNGVGPGVWNEGIGGRFWNGGRCSPQEVVDVQDRSECKKE